MHDRKSQAFADGFGNIESLGLQSNKVIDGQQLNRVGAAGNQHFSAYTCFESFKNSDRKRHFRN